MSRAASRLALLLILTAAAPACRSGTSTSGPEEPAEPKGPPPPPFDVTDARLDVSRLTADSDGRTVALDPKAATIEVPAGWALALTTWQRLTDFRVRLVDDRDHLVPYHLESGPVAVRSEARPEPGGTWVRVVPDPALEVGDTYLLEIEGEQSDSVHDQAGRTYEDLVLTLQAVEPPPEAPQPPEPGPSGPDGGENAAEAPPGAPAPSPEP